MLASCIGDEPTEDPVLGEEEASSGPFWIPIDGCATSIGVAPDDTVWVLGCGTQADREVWYWRREGDGFGDTPIWTRTSQTGASIFVDNAGQAIVKTSQGHQWFYILVNHDGRVARPTGQWTRWQLFSDGTLADAQFNHDEPYLVFHTTADFGVNPF